VKEAPHQKHKEVIDSVRKYVLGSLPE